MLWFKKFMAKHGAFFVGIYFLTFFLLTTLRSKFEFEAFYGDIAFDIGSFTVYLPFASAFASAIFMVTIFSVYRFLKN